MDVCFWCRQAKDETDTTGVPEFFDYDACDRCQSKMDEGITIIQVDIVRNENPAIKDNIYPTGKWVVVKENRILEDFKEWKSLTEVIQTRCMFMNKATWDSYGLS